jgi:disulfide bond formation protein DsbB
MLFASIIPPLVLTSHVVLGLLVLAIIFKFERITAWISQRALLLGLLISIVAVVGSLFYSNVVGFVPCDLCWWQRIFIYPALPMFAIAAAKKDYHIFRFITPMALIAALISIYHLFVQMGGNSILPCSASASCDKLYVFEFGYVTIPTMALTVSVTFLLLAWASRKHE